MKIVLIGNQGQVGREVQELAQNKGYLVIGFDLNNLDITNASQVDMAFNHLIDADILINAAGFTAVDKAEDEKEAAYAVNCAGVENLARASRKLNIPIIHISTDYVFDGKKQGAYQEIDEANPLSVYGKSKLAGETALARIWEKHIILRISWVFGRYGNNFVKTILRLAQERETLNIVDDQYGCPTASLDTAQVLLKLAKSIKHGKNLWGIYNYCGYNVTTWYDFAAQIIDIAKHLTPNPLKIKQLNRITTAQYRTKAVRPHNSELLVKKIISDYGVERHGWLEHLTAIINSPIDVWNSSSN